MAFNLNSYSAYFRAIQSPVCAVFGPTGAQGSGGSTGPTGPIGPAGTNGISTGLIYYFHAEGPAGQPPSGYTGFVMNTNIRPGPAGGNPVYLPTVYNGYFSEIHPTAGTTGPILLGDFKTSAGDPGVTVIPPGAWTFLMNIYTGVDYTGVGNTGITGSAGTSINVYAEVWKTSQGVSSLIGDNKTRSIVVNSASDDQLYSMGVTVQTAQTLFTPLVDSMFVRFYAVPTTSTFVANQRIEFWTDGDSVSQVTTTLPAKTGNTGSTGPAGPTGKDGLPGKDGIGSQGIQGPTGNSFGGPLCVFRGGTGNIAGRADEVSDFSSLLSDPTSNAITLSFGNSSPIYQSAAYTDSPIIAVASAQDGRAGFSVSKPGTYKAVLSSPLVTPYARIPFSFWSIPLGINVGSYSTAGSANMQYCITPARQGGTGITTPITMFFYFATTTPNTLIFVANNFSVFATDPLVATDKTAFDVVFKSFYTIEFSKLS